MAHALLGSLSDTLQLTAMLRSCVQVSRQTKTMRNFGRLRRRRLAPLQLPFHSVIARLVGAAPDRTQACRTPCDWPAPVSITPEKPLEGEENIAANFQHRRRDLRQAMCQLASLPAFVPRRERCGGGKKISLAWSFPSRHPDAMQFWLWCLDPPWVLEAMEKLVCLLFAATMQMRVYDMSMFCCRYTVPALFDFATLTIACALRPHRS